MGCCIPRKKCIFFVNANKKNTQIITTKCEKLSERFNINKSMANLQLQKYYLPIPVQNNCLFENKISRKINIKKIKRSMNKLKELSSKEVNNCRRYFIFNQNILLLND